MTSTAPAGTVVRKALPANATVDVDIVDDCTVVEDELELLDASYGGLEEQSKEIDVSSRRYQR